MIDMTKLGTGGRFKWTKEYLFKILTTGKNPVLKDPLLINAFQKIDRADFIPEKLRNQSYNDSEIDIGFGETLTKPTEAAKVLSLLKPKYGGKYLDIGTGSGYSAVILGFIAGDEGHVYSLERIQLVWEKARENSKKYTEVKNIDFLYRDGIDGFVNKAPYDGIHVAFSFDEVPEKLKQQLKTSGGILVVPMSDMNLRVIERRGVDEYYEEIVPGFPFPKIKEGMA